MDSQRAIEVLEWWVSKAKAATRFTAGIESDSREFQELQAREDLTRRVLARVQGVRHLPELLIYSTMNDNYWADQGIREVEYALGKLRTEEEARSILGSSAPTMDAEALHPLIWSAAAKRWESEHYADAVQRAATALSSYVKDQTGRYELGDRELITQAFSLNPPQEGKPRLRWPGRDDDLTVKSMREGILSLAQGAFAAIRNPASHSAHDIPRQEAFEQLATLSILARWTEKCELVRAQEA